VAKLPSIQQQNAATLEAMGKSAGSLTALLGQGSKGFNSLADEAQRYGIVLDEQLLRAAGPANDQLDRMKMILDAQFAQAVAKNVGGLLALAAAFGKVGSAATDALGAVGDYIRGRQEIAKNSTTFGPFSLDFTTPAEAARIGARARVFDDIMAGDLRANGLPGFERTRGGVPTSLLAGAGGGGGAGGRSRTSAPRGPADIYGGLSAADIRMGFGESKADVLGQGPALSSGLDESLSKAVDLRKALDDVAASANAIPPVEPINERTIEFGQQFAADLSQSLASAIVLGENLGDALVNSLKRAAIEALANGLFSLLGRLLGGGGGIIGAIGGLLGFANGGRPPTGRASLVGERGPELFVPDSAGTVVSNELLRAVGQRAGRREAQEQQVRLRVDPSPGFIITVVEGAATVAEQTVDQRIARSQRRLLPAALGV
jgi:hypothetical protein